MVSIFDIEPALGGLKLVFSSLEIFQAFEFQFLTIGLFYRSISNSFNQAESLLLTLENTMERASLLPTSLTKREYLLMDQE
jgi:hypothetical protein